GRDIGGAQLLDRLFQHCGAAHGTGGALAAAFAAIRIWGGNAVDVDEPRLERCLVRLARRGGKREQRAAVVAGTQSDDAVLARLPALDPVLSGELQCGFDRLGAATKEVELREIAWERVGDLVGQV